MTQMAELNVRLTDSDQTTEEEHDFSTPMVRLSRAVRQASSEMTRQQARHLVSIYYTMQRQRIRAASQVRASAEPAPVLTWFADGFAQLESRAKSALKIYADSHDVGRWSQSIVGIGPVISAGLLAHIDMEIAINPSRVWSFAGLDPSRTWGKGEKRPWNAQLKTLCFQIGESFVRQSAEKSYYRRAYEERKAYEVRRNDRGDNAAEAQRLLQEKSYGENVTREALESGKLSNGHIDRRARRWVAKMFLSHWHQVAWETTYGDPPERPYVIVSESEDCVNHTHYTEAPGWPMGG